MENGVQPRSGCCAGDSRIVSSGVQIQAQLPTENIENGSREAVCCGSPPGPRSSPYEKPGYQLLHFVDGFIDTPVGSVPRVKTRLVRSDFMGTLTARVGIRRNQYKVAPGLYGVGNPDRDSPVLVTANYKLSFDAVRRELTGIDAWILVVDTRGINVWCAAGKALFGTREVVLRVAQTGLKAVVRHNRLVLPQLGATGVSALQVKRESGFTVLWGPIRAQDIRQFLVNGCQADKSMRRLTFSIAERIVLIPVELSHLLKPTLWILPALFLISGIGSDLFAIEDGFRRGLILLSACVAGIFSGAVVVPVLLPWIPVRTFALKGMLIGFVAGLADVVAFYGSTNWAEKLVLVLIAMVISSFLAMNFTGSTPFTSPSGVEKEMRKAIPVQAAVALIAVAAWVGAAFV